MHMRYGIDTLNSHLQQIIIGQSALRERLLVSLLTGGHLLIEGLPGLAKTTAARALADGMQLDFRRIQFTPDLIPGDITGSEIFLPDERSFNFVPGPLFTDILLADEINRAPPKVQSALLEAMQERQVTAGGVTRPLSPWFLVIATQNPLEHEGTYPLPEAQLDRFMMKVNVEYPDTEQELAILEQAQRQRQRPQTVLTSPPALTTEQLATARAAVNGIYIDDMVKRYIVQLVAATRHPEHWDQALSGQIEYGASPRATLALAYGAQALALLRDRDFVEPGDVITLAGDILNHRIGLGFTARAEGLTPRQFIDRLLQCVPAP
ncbi:MAG: MoxR family ATPase [Gammaproteobacteria bacterium]|nr:MoxR family ATPase [Gammaproteobacteria bacterium]